MKRVNDPTTTMKRLLSNITVLSLCLAAALSSLPALALAGSIPAEPIDRSPLDRLKGVGTSAGYKPAEPTTLADTVGGIISGLLSLLGVIFLGYIIYGGFKWMIARGNEEEVEKAKGIIRQATIGLIIILAAYAITAFVTSQLGAATGYNQR